MITTVIRLPEEDHKLYKELARENNESLAEFFRKAARNEARVNREKITSYSIFDLGTKIVSRVGPKDGSVNHDKYYYEYENKKRKIS